MGGHNLCTLQSARHAYFRSASRARVCAKGQAPTGNTKHHLWSPQITKVKSKVTRARALAHNTKAPPLLLHLLAGCALGAGPKAEDLATLGGKVAATWL